MSHRCSTLHYTAVSGNLIRHFKVASPQPLPPRAAARVLTEALKWTEISSLHLVHRMNKRVNEWNG